MSLKRTPFARKPPAAFVKAERIPEVYARQTVPVRYPVFDEPLATLPKENAVYSEPYRRIVAAMPCVVCGIHGYSQAAHPPPTAKGRKEDDRLTFALCTIHPDASGQLVNGCHFEFDQMQMVPREDMRSVAGHWAKQTRQQIRDAGQWPASVPHFEDPELELVP
jgi:hypothetical protein